MAADRHSQTARTLAQVLFVLALVGAVTLALMPHPPQLLSDRMGDKFHHMLAFSTLAALACWGWPEASRWRIIERLSFAGALIEVFQSIPGLHRDCDIRDWVADTVAIVVVVGLLEWSRRSSPQSPRG